MVELAKVEMSTSQVMDAIPGVMDLAAAGAISVGGAANLTAATLNTFGLEASKSTEVADTWQQPPMLQPPTLPTWPLAYRMPVPSLPHLDRACRRWRR